MPRGSAPGERRGGRQKGTPNKATAEVKEAARAYTADAINTLAQIMKAGESEAARVAAANAILDRGYGKPKQSVEHEGGETPISHVHRIERVIVDPKA
jgi:hypothetical protein